MECAKAFFTLSLFLFPDMLFNSSFSNESLPLLHNEDLFLQHYCLLSNIIVFKMYHAINIALMFPLCIFILYHGLQQRRKASSTLTMGHSDCFTYHMVSMEMIGVSGSLLIVFVDNSGDAVYFVVYGCVATLIWHGQTLFHLLTCVERYLAVVHAIVYMRLKNEQGVRMRNVTICCVWLCCIVTMSFSRFKKVLVIVDFCLLMISLAVVSFCSSMVLCILVRPGPGKQSLNRDKLNQSKQRALYTIASIFGALLLRFFGSTTWTVVQVFDSNSSCVVMMTAIWFQVPSSLVIPLLYLHRAGKLGVCNKVHT